jgi:hypothetical protein
VNRSITMIGMVALVCAAGAANSVEIVNAPQDSLCAPGFQQLPVSRCMPLVIPANAHIDSSGHDWKCNPGYRQRGRKCERIESSNPGPAPGHHARIVLPPECHDHRNSNQSGRSPDILRRCD